MSFEMVAVTGSAADVVFTTGRGHEVRSPFKPVVAAAALASAGAVGTGMWIAARDDPSPEPGLAHLWVDTDAGSCTRSSEPAEYVDEAACSSLDAANDVCQGGDTVLVKGGTYGSQTLTGTHGRTSFCTFKPAPSETANMPTILLASSAEATDGASWVRFDGEEDMRLKMTGTDVQIRGNSSNVELLNIDGANWNIFGALQQKSNITVRGGDWGPCHADDLPSNCNIKIDASVDNVMFEDAYVHEIMCSNHDCRDCTDGTPGCEIHLECMIVFRGVSGLTIRGNRFRDCEFFDLLMQNIGGGDGAIEHVAIENNWFAQPRNGAGGVATRSTAVSLSPRGQEFSNLLIRFNSFHGGAGIDWNGDADGTMYTNVRGTGNLIGDPVCYGSVRYRYNVYDGASTCSGTGEVALNDAFPYVNGSNSSSFDYSLAGSATSIEDLVPKSVTDGCPPTDIFGTTRPQGTKCDAGSHETL